MSIKTTSIEVILVAGICVTVGTLVGAGFGIPAGAVSGIAIAALFGVIHESRS